MNVPIGHRLPAHMGKCKNYHGHNYAITAYIRGAVGEETGMVMDYHDLKAAMRDVLEPYDHAMVLQTGDPLIPFLAEQQMRYLVFDRPPTAENLALHLQSRIAEVLAWDLDKVSVQIRETPDSEASV